MSKRICIDRCEFMAVDKDKISCEMYDTQLEIEKFDPGNFTFTVLKCSKCMEAEVKKVGDEDQINRLEQLGNELKFFEDYFYRFISDFEESLASINAVVQTMKEEGKENV